MAFEPTPDDLAGVVDLFGGLTRPELGRACRELAFKRGEDVAADGFDAAIRRAVEAYALVAVTHGGSLLLVTGPTAFPGMPDGAADLPHILDVPARSVPRSARAERVATRLESEAAAAVDDGDAERAARLREVSYDAESWADLELAAVRERLAAVEA